MPAHDWDAIDTKLDLALHHLIVLRQWRNLLASPLFCLPTELILEIFVHAVELNGGVRFWVTLTAICRILRELLIHSSLPWRVVNFSSIHLAKLFLERCKFNPLVLFATNYKWSISVEAGRAALWEELEGRTFNNLRFLLFQGSRHEFNHRVVDLLRRAPNLSSLEVETNLRARWDLEWPLGDRLPHLTMLRLSNVRINWTVPLLRNLTKLILRFPCIGSPHRVAPIKMFLAMLINCPDLEILQLISAGPNISDSNQDNWQVVRLRNLQDLILRFDGQNIAGCILSHVWFPESTKVKVEISCYVVLCVALPQVLPPPSMETSQYLRKTKTITINLNTSTYELTTDNLHLVLLPPDDDARLHRLNLETLPQFASNLVEIIGIDAVVALYVLFSLPYDILREVWQELLHGFPRLETISYFTSFESGWDSEDPFCSVFSEPFEGGPVCPRLWDLRIPRAFTRGSSAVTLKRALLERDGCGGRLKRISITQWVEEDETPALWPFRDVVDEISRSLGLSSWFLLSVSRFLGRDTTLEN